MTPAQSINSISFFGPVEGWRRSGDPQLLSLIFKFDDFYADFTTVREALHQAYGRSSFGDMYMMCRGVNSMMIDARFKNYRKRRRMIGETMLYGSTKMTIGDRQVNVKVIPTLPIQPRLTLYKVTNVPGLSETDACIHVRNGVINRLKFIPRIVERPGTRDEDRLVDVVPGYDGDGPKYATARSKYSFNGTVYIILRDYSNLGKKGPHFIACGKWFTGVQKSMHYSYCEKCKSMDSHVAVDCPFPLEYYAQ